MLGKRNRPRDGREKENKREREEKRKTVRGRKKEVPSKRQTVPAPDSQWVWGASIPGSSEEAAGLCLLPKGIGHGDTDREGTRGQPQGRK